MMKSNLKKLNLTSGLALENSISPCFLFDDMELLGFDCLESALKSSQRNFKLDENAMAFFLRLGFLPPPYAGLKEVDRKYF